MNEFIFNELKKCKVAQIPEYDENTQELFIPKGSKPSIIDIIKLDNEYIIEVADYILNPPANFSLHTNWNNGIIPKHKYMQCIITKVVGKMVKVQAFGFDLEKFDIINDFWEGWLPQASITIIKEVK